MVVSGDEMSDSGDVGPGAGSVDDLSGVSYLGECAAVCYDE